MAASGVQHTSRGSWPVLGPHQVMMQQCGEVRCVRPRHLEIGTLSELAVLRSARLEQVVERVCRRCEQPFLVKRSLALRRPARYCSARCSRGWW
jgi:hypothetical protein